MSDKETRLKLLNLELHGLEVELDVKRQQHRTITAQIEHLEAEREDVAAKIEATKHQLSLF